MQTSYEVPSPGGYGKQQVYKFAEQLSREARSKLPKFDIRAIIEKIGGHITYEDISLNPESSGSIFVDGPNSFRIILPTHTSESRDNFTLAHELGHYILHSKNGTLRIVANRIGSGQLEWEANWFAASFLMPNYLITDDIKTAEAMTSIFGVSLDAAKIRIKDRSL